MKNFLYRLHSKWSLLTALCPRLWFFEDTLLRSYPELWQYRLELPRKDYVIFFPYIISVEGVRVGFKNLRLSWGLRKKTVKDPINIVAYGVSPKEFISILKQTNPAWKQFLGSSYFLYGSTNCGWQASIAIKMDIDEHACERHHIRLLGFKTAHGEKVTLCAAHHDAPHHRDNFPPLSWDETRNLVGRNIVTFPYHFTDPVTEPNWRGTDGDGKILVIICRQ